MNRSAIWDHCEINLSFCADGFSNKEIAQKLHISTYTVKSHVHNILEKLALHTRVQIAKYAHVSDSFKTAVDTTSLISEWFNCYKNGYSSFFDLLDYLQTCSNCLDLF